jgi:hypothetical protein
MKASKAARKFLAREIQHGFMQAWSAESRARKEQQRAESQKAKSPHWSAFWKRAAQSLKPAQQVPVAKAASSGK